MDNVGMPSAKDHPSPGLRQGQRVQFSRGHWRSEASGGAIRSAGWWESVTVTWSSAPASERRPAALHRVLATAAEAFGPVVADLIVASGQRLLERPRGGRTALPVARRRLPALTRALPRPDRTPP